MNKRKIRREKSDASNLRAHQISQVGLTVHDGKELCRDRHHQRLQNERSLRREIFFIRVIAESKQCHIIVIIATIARLEREKLGVCRPLRVKIECYGIWRNRPKIRRWNTEGHLKIDR